MKAFVKKTKREIEVYATPESVVGSVKFYDKDHPEDIYSLDELVFVGDYYDGK